jgi:hypothetical protein
LGNALRIAPTNRYSEIGPEVNDYEW